MVSQLAFIVLALHYFVIKNQAATIGYSFNDNNQDLSFTSDPSNTPLELPRCSSDSLNIDPDALKNNEQDIEKLIFNQNNSDSSFTEDKNDFIESHSQDLLNGDMNFKSRFSSNNQIAKNLHLNPYEFLQLLSIVHNLVPLHVPSPKLDSCTTPNGETGVCTSMVACNKVFSGRPSGSCNTHRVCCISTVTSCGEFVTVNNTYWQSPVNQLAPPSTCALTIQLDSRIYEQKSPICQVRLDFLSFNIEQPNAETVCSTDSFRVGGYNTNRVPVICGENSGQHMYLNVPDSKTTPSNLQLVFSFGATNFQRTWNIKIAFLPCGANYLAPSDCLQYFSSPSGIVRSFNWIDSAGTNTRQLANQDYSICFRNEIITNKRSSSLCFSVCPNVRRPFSISTPVSTTNPIFGLIGCTNQLLGCGYDSLIIPVAVPVQVSNRDLGDESNGTISRAYVSQSKPTSCNNDFLLIPGGYDPDQPVGPDNTSDRLCGEVFNSANGASTNAQVCTSALPFSILYRTNENESITSNVDLAGQGNAGFCLTFTLRP